MRDDELLAHYLTTGCHDAFGQLVDKHIGLVYSAACRQVGDRAMAQDVTQAVFLVLLRRARTVRSQPSLAGWLIKTTQYTALTAVRSRARKNRHEREAADMRQRQTDATETRLAPELIAPVLDDALSRLNDRDRTVLTLRFLQQKSVADVAAALGVSEPAAQKRLSRALGRLRDVFARRGIDTADDALAFGLSRQTVYAVPPELAVAAAGLARVAPGAAAAAMAKATTHGLCWGPVKAAALGAAGFGVAAMVIVAAAQSPSATRATATAPVATATAPSPVLALVASTAAQGSPDTVRVPDLVFVDRSTPDQYLAGIDPQVERSGSGPVGYIRSLGKATGHGTRAAQVAAEPFHGKRVRVSGWVRTRDVKNWAGIQVSVVGLDGRLLSNDDMADRPITGSADWRQYDCVLDVADDAAGIVVSFSIYGMGEAWMNDFRVEPVPSSVPITDDRTWRKWSPNPAAYAVATDPAVQRDGHPTRRISTVGPTPPGSWVVYNLNDYDVDKYAGKRVRVTAWLKSDGLTHDAGPWGIAMGAGGAVIARDGQRGHRPVRRTSDWNRYTVEFDVPFGMERIAVGVCMNGRGTLWVDGPTYELAGDPPAPGK